MHPSPRLLVLLCFASLAGIAAAKKPAPKTESLDAPPVLVSTKGNAPKWRNVEELKQFALRGDPQACMELADRSQEGDGVPKDIKQAELFFERAAKAGAPNGWFRLGKIYHDGLDGSPDYAKAMDYFTQAARAGVAEAQYNLGAMFVSARGVKRDYIEGLAWLIVAKKSGAPGDAAEQVRKRLARRPADIAAAETRAAEISANLANASVRTGASLPPPIKPVEAPKVDEPSAVKSGVVAPKIDPIAPPKIDVTPPPPPGGTPPRKP